MAYTPETRIVTIEFIREREDVFEILVTPEQVVARFRDRILWKVQGLPDAMAAQVSVGNFVLLERTARVRRRGRGLDVVRPRPIPPARRGERGALVDLGRADVGFYKYDVVFDGRTIADPEIEIRGPRA